MTYALSQQVCHNSWNTINLEDLYEDLLVCFFGLFLLNIGNLSIFIANSEMLYCGQGEKKEKKKKRKKKKGKKKKKEKKNKNKKKK